MYETRISSSATFDYSAIVPLVDTVAVLLVRWFTEILDAATVAGAFEVSNFRYLIVESVPEKPN